MARRARGTEAAAAPAPNQSNLGLIWTRPPMPKAERLTQQGVVAAAITLADTEGLEAVSIRRVAAEVNTRPKTLYARVARKDDLIDLMVDEVIGEAVLDAVPADWREALSEIAARTRAGCLRHPWIMTAVAQRPRIGPNAMRHKEQSLAAVARTNLAHRYKQALLIAVDTYTLGHVMGELAERELRRRERYTDDEWAEATQRYFQRLIDTGGFPHVKEFGPGDIASTRDPDFTFQAGLDWLLTGAATALQIRSGNT